jgi:hypothetical protein
VRESDCDFASRSTWDYNCVGFAVGDYRWWHYEEHQDYFWPGGVKRSGWARSYVEALKTVHVEECKDSSPEPGYEKIAVYHRGGRFKHVAVIDAPKWKSKLGEYEDIEHPPDAMEKSTYGKVFKYLRRSLQYVRDALPDEYKL